MLVFGIGRHGKIRPKKETGILFGEPEGAFGVSKPVLPRIETALREAERDPRAARTGKTRRGQKEAK